VDSKANAIARKIVSDTVNQLSDSQRADVQEWATRSLAIVENKSLSKKDKLIELQKVRRTKAVLRIIVALGRVIKAKSWDNQSWARRLSIGGLALGSIAFGKEAAGLAAFGGAVGVPLAFLTAGGAMVLGVLVDECQKTDRNSKK
jgi:hypothetical protein